MKITITHVALAVLGIFAACFLLINYQAKSVVGSAISGLPSRQIVATTTQVGPQLTVTIFGANSNCTARIIRTQGEQIYLLFGDPTDGNLSSTTLTGVAGFFQAASTTVAYDGGIYGCGRWTAESLASSTITTSEMY